MPNTRRVQILMEPEEYERLEQVARRRHISLGELLRQAARSCYPRAEEERVAAADAIASMNLGAGSWEDAKQAIEEGYDAGLR